MVEFEITTRLCTNTIGTVHKRSLKIPSCTKLHSVIELHIKIVGERWYFAFFGVQIIMLISLYCKLCNILFLLSPAFAYAETVE